MKRFDNLAPPLHFYPYQPYFLYMQHLRHTLLAALMLLSLTLSAQWSSQGTGLSGGNLRIISFSVVSPSVVWGVAGGAGANSSRAFTLTTDGGTTFTTGTINEAASDYTNVFIFAQSADVAYVVQNKRAEGDEARMFRTSDGGNNWEELPGPFNQDGHNVKALHFFDASNGVAFGSAGTAEANVQDLHIYTTSDGGNNWTEVSNLPALLSPEGTWTSAGNNGYEAIGNTIWFGTNAKRVWKSTNQGLSWTATQVPFQNTSGGANSVAFQDADNGVVVSEFGEAAVTSDGGATWSAVTIPSTPVPAVVEYIPDSDGTYLVADGIYALADLSISNDGGQTWTSFVPQGQGGGPTTISPIGLVFQSSSQGLASTGITDADQGGILSWEDPLPGATGIFDGLAEIEGLQAFPNPTHDRVSLQWTDTRVQQIDLLDAQGRRLQQVTPGLAQTQAVSLAAYPAGIYLIRVLAQGQQSTLRILKN